MAERIGLLVREHVVLRGHWGLRTSVGVKGVAAVAKAAGRDGKPNYECLISSNNLSI